MKQIGYVVALVLMSPAAFADRTVDETKSVSGNGDVVVDIVVGSVEITGWDRNEVHVTGSLGDDVEEFIFEVDGSETTIEVKVPQNRRRADANAELKIQVPAGSSLSVQTVSAPITMSGVTGENHELDAVNGKVIVTGCSGDIHVETVSGGIEITGSHGSVDASTVNGPIVVRGVEQSLSAEAISGSIKVEGAALERVDFETVSGSVTYDGGLADNGTLDAESINGSVTLNFPAPVEGRYDIETFNGRIETDFGPQAERKSRFGPGNTLEFTHGDGSARISIETFNGSVTIHGGK